MSRLRVLRRRSVAAALTLVALAASGGGRAHPPGPGAPGGLAAIDHIVVVYEENHSFDNLFGGWEGVDGLRAAARGGAPRTAPPDQGRQVDAAGARQVDAAGVPLPCLPQSDVNLAALPVTCHGTSSPAAGATRVDSAFRNRPFQIDRYLAPGDATCPAPGVSAPDGVLRDSPGALPGGCTRDLVHRFYQEQYQIDGGRMDRYVAGSDALGLVMGYYDTRALPVYRYLHGPGAPRYAVADRFFQAAFGGSFLNHQWLVAAATPTWPGAVADGGDDDLHSVVGPDGMPIAYPLHPAPGYVRDRALTQAAAVTSGASAAVISGASAAVISGASGAGPGACAVPAGAQPPPRGTVCGDFAVNTVQPPYQPYQPGTAESKRLPAQTAPTIGDRLSAAGVDWAWYAGGWDDASGNVGGPGWTNGGGGTCGSPRTAAGAEYPYCPDATFQYHHQPFNYFASFAPGTAARAAHLRDEVEFEAAARSGRLRPVSFVKPLGEENEHPGYASEHTGSRHLVELLRAVAEGPQADRTLVIVTYDEFGGQWDHVPPPRGDRWGPGTRIPALVVSPRLSRPFAVDHTGYDTTSVLATIEHRFRLAPLGARDARARPIRLR